MSGGKPLKPRFDVPDGFEIHPYGNQKQNIWEMQKETLRKVIEKDKEHFYTYSKDYMSGSFPLVNENEIQLKEKLESISRWTTKKGFDNIGKKSNWNEHPLKPDAGKIADLKYPRIKQETFTKNILKGKQYQPSLDGKPDFINRKPSQQTFSKPNYFNTVFISGDGMAKENAEAKQK